MAFSEHSHTWLPEPTVPDETYGQRREQPIDWLMRSTLPRAKEARRFINEHLSKMPMDAQQSIFQGLRTRWQSAFFELIVALILQELGATILVEHMNVNERRPDFTASFTDG